MENKMKGLHVKTNSNAAGAALLNTTGKLSIAVAATIFAVDPEDVKVERNKFETFGKPQTKKAKKFLEMIKG
jgi:Zn-finger domain-containing protein